MRFLPVPENECERIAFILKLQPMFIVNSYALAVLFCFITMMCWGSWGNTQKLASKSWRYELFYWDYVIGMVLFTLVVGFTMGSIGSEGRSFLPDLAQADARGVGERRAGRRDLQRLEHPALGVGGHGGAVGRLSAGCRTGTGAGRRRQLRGCAQRRSRHPVSGRGADRCGDRLQRHRLAAGAERRYAACAVPQGRRAGGRGRRADVALLPLRRGCDGSGSFRESDAGHVDALFGGLHLLAGRAGEQLRLQYVGDETPLRRGARRLPRLLQGQLFDPSGRNAGRCDLVSGYDVQLHCGR